MVIINGREVHQSLPSPSSWCPSTTSQSQAWAHRRCACPWAPLPPYFEPRAASLSRVTCLLSALKLVLQLSLGLGFRSPNSCVSSALLLCFRSPHSPGERASECDVHRSAVLSCGPSLHGQATTNTTPGICLFTTHCVGGTGGCGAGPDGTAGDRG